MQDGTGRAGQQLAALPVAPHGALKTLWFGAVRGEPKLQVSSAADESYVVTLNPPNEQTGFALPVPEGCAERTERDGRTAAITQVGAWISGGAIGEQRIELRFARAGVPGSATLMYAWEQQVVAQVVACPATATTPAVVVAAWLELQPGWNLIVTAPAPQSSVQGVSGPAVTVQVTSVPLPPEVWLDLIPADH